MKISVEFNLPDDEHDYQCFMKSKVADRTLDEFREFLRSTEKYGKPEEWTFEKVFDKFWEIVKENDYTF